MHKGYITSGLSKEQKKEHYLQRINRTLQVVSKSNEPEAAPEEAKVLPLYPKEEPKTITFPEQPRFASQPIGVLVRNLPECESFSFNYRIKSEGDEPWN